MNVAIIAAAGRGTRMGGEQAKQFRELAGTPIIIHTLRRFEQCRTIEEVIAVVPSSDVSGILELAEKYAVRKLARVVAGGGTRAVSVWHGLQAVAPASVEIVAVHDGVRPFVTPEEIDRTVRAAGECGAAILAARVVDTIKEADTEGRVVRTHERARLWHAQTPQCFRYEILRRAYVQAAAEQREATDDSVLVERLGVTVSIVEGSAHNIKITDPEDIALAEVLVQSSKYKVQG